MFVLQVIACILIADFLTGVVHWIEDTYGLPTWWGIGAAVIEPNILHHKDPLDFTRSTFLMRNYQPFLLAAAAILAVWCVGWLTWQVALVTCLAAFGNEVHAWAHRRPKNRVARLLQDMAIVQTPHQHAKHHHAPYDKYFCTLTNVVNPICEALCVFTAMEWLLACFGVLPQRMSEARGGV